MDEVIEDKANLIQHDVELTAGQGRTAKTNSCKTQAHALDDAKSILTCLTWRENLEELIIAKGVETDFPSSIISFCQSQKAFQKPNGKKPQACVGALVKRLMKNACASCLRCSSQRTQSTTKPSTSGTSESLELCGLNNLQPG